MTQAAIRTTRQKAIGRFRTTRIGNASGNLAERQRGIIAAAERVLALTDMTQETLERTRGDRKDWSAAMRKALTDGAAELKAETIEKLAALLSARKAQGMSDKKMRREDFDQLRKEVVRIVTEDFC